MAAIQQILLGMGGKGSDSYWISLLNYGSASSQDFNYGWGITTDSSDNIYLQGWHGGNSKEMTYKLDNDGALQYVRYQNGPSGGGKGMCIAKGVSHSSYNSGTPYDALMKGISSSNHGSGLKIDTDLQAMEETGGQYTSWQDHGQIMVGGAYTVSSSSSASDKYPTWWGGGKNGYMFRGRFTYNQEGTSSSKHYLSNGMHGWGRTQIYEGGSYSSPRYEGIAIEIGSGSSPNWSPKLDWAGSFYLYANGGWRGFIANSNGNCASSGSNQQGSFNPNWCKKVSPKLSNGGTSGNVFSTGVATDASSVYSCYIQNDGTGAINEAIIVKTTNGGSLNWIGVLSDKSGEETGNNKISLNGCEMDSSGKLYAMGRIQGSGSTGGQGIIIICVNSDSTLAWQRVLYRRDTSYRYEIDVRDDCIKLNSSESLIITASWRGSTSGVFDKYMAMTMKLPADGSKTGTHSTTATGSASGNGWIYSASSFGWRTSTSSGGNNCPNISDVSLYGNVSNAAQAQNMGYKDQDNSFSGPSVWEKIDVS